jgi:hypothetical protein
VISPARGAPLLVRESYKPAASARTSHRFDISSVLPKLSVERRLILVNTAVGCLDLRIPRLGPGILPFYRVRDRAGAVAEATVEDLFLDVLAVLVNLYY